MIMKVSRKKASIKDTAAGYVTAYPVDYLVYRVTYSGVASPSYYPTSS
jgi:hypothetical protein